MITKRSKNKMSRKSTRVDFTPMVDMNMLLLTFFMFCTTLSKPQVMDLAMPVPDMTDTPNVPESRSVTFILDDKNKVYYYEGLPNYDDYTSLKEISYEGVRNVLIRKNEPIITQVNKIEDRESMSKEAYKRAVQEIKRQDKGAIAIIKPTDKAVYENLVDILDEMAICNVGRYSVSDMTDADRFLVENYKTKGILTQE